MLNLSILDYPDHADPVKRLTEHVVNKVVSPSRAPYRSGNSASVRTQPSATRPQCALMLARDLLSSFWRRGERATTRLSTSSSSILNSSKRILLLENPESVRMLALFRSNLGSNANE